MRYCATTLMLGWHAYLLCNASGRRYPRWTSHLDPSAPLFAPQQRAWVALSDAGLVATALGLWAMGRVIGPLNLFLMYVAVPL